MKAVILTKTEQKVLIMALKNDDRVQQHYSKEIFNCHYLPDIIQVLSAKLTKFFNLDDNTAILATEYHKVIKIDGTKARIGIYRIVPKFKLEIEGMLKSIASKSNSRIDI